MSHYTVTVRMTEKRLQAFGGDVETALESMMAPYEEQTEDRKYQTFRDMEDEYRAEYEGDGTIRQLKDAAGALYSPYDDRFAKAGMSGILGSDTHVVPAGFTEVEVPYKQAYKTFEEFCAKYHGSTRDKESGRHGYWENPNAKWDWYVIGGRWTGHFPLLPTAKRVMGRPGTFGKAPKPGHGDVVRLLDVDMTAVSKETVIAAEKFFAEYNAWLRDPLKKFGAFEGPRETARTLGLCQLVQETVTAKPGQVVAPWKSLVKPGDDRASWTDVLTVIDKATFMKDYLDHFNPLVTYAALDNDGWHEPGQMGWFGCSRAKPEDVLRFSREFASRFLQGHSDLLVLVDCHI